MTIEQQAQDLIKTLRPSCASEQTAEDAAFLAVNWFMFRLLDKCGLIPFDQWSACDREQYSKLSDLKEAIDRVDAQEKTAEEQYEEDQREFRW